MVHRLAALVVLLLGAARVEAQGRVVPEPRAPRRARVVPAPRTATPRQPRPRTVPAPRTKAPVVRSVPAPARQVPAPARRAPATVSAPSVGQAQAPASVPGSQLSVTLVTFGVGEAVWERFGHNALWIHDAGSGQDIAYNWGLFDFEQPGFFQRFLTGDTKYWMGGEDAFTMVTAYHNIGRPITLQTLNLTPAQALALRDFVERNALEENKYYRYDYFRDNCSTRLRDAIDRALSGKLRAATDTVHTALTYRTESLRLTDGDLPVQTGIDIALGRGADTPLTAWESFFIPMRLRDAVRIVNIPGPDGTLVPLVASERVMAPSSGVPRVVEPRAAPDHTRRNLLVGLGLAALFMFFRLLSRSQRWAVWVVGILGMLWSLVCGALGVILLLAWVATKHVFWAQNENLLLLSPVSLALVILVPAALLAGRAVRRTRIVAVIVAATGLIALVLTLTPGGQPNREIVALILPMHLALVAALFFHVPRRIRATPAPKE
jgi:hypothetical protein